MSTLDFLASLITPAWRPPFRGEIYEYASKLNLQSGYRVKGFFDIESCCHIKAPLEAIRSPRIQVVSIMAAIQTLKSLIADLTLCFWAEHDRDDVLWLYEDSDKAKLMAKTRIMPLLTSVPEIAAELAREKRFAQTNVQIRLPGMQLLVAGLNLGNVQSASWRRVVVDEGWIHGNDGLIGQAMDRTKQAGDSKKIILMGQGGAEDDDADIEHKKTHRYELHYACRWQRRAFRPR
jgi:Phage terminase large subunit gpA, ATPase domain